jgi:ABC-type branched-subunit amino acid transport system ATPase component
VNELVEYNALLTATEVKKSFGGLTAINHVSFSLREGQIKSIIGPNGAGKTTLLNLIMGIYPPDSGKIAFLNQSIERLKPHHIASLGISRTFQTIALFENMSVVENVMVGKHVRTKSEFFSNSFLLRRAKIEEDLISRDAWEKLALVGLKERGLEPASAITFAEQRLLEIARALATDPKIILLDEPAAGLNITEIKMMSQLIQKIRSQGVTVLLVEHQMGLVMDISDEILVLNYGSKIAEGPPSEIQRNQDVIKAYLGEEIEIAEG